MCTMCGKHVQKSYGCFRRESAPERLMHLFTPGMNRIKICRRCLPYKKQSGSGEDNKKTGRKSGEKILRNDSRKIENVVDHIANRDTSIMKTETTNDKPVSTATLDAIHRKLNAANVATNARFTSPSKIVLNESAKGEAMEYIKKLAENLKANYSQEVGTPTVQNKTPFSQQHPSSKNPETPSANQIETSLVSERTCEKTGTNQVITGRWAPVMVNHGSSTVTPPPNVVQPIVRPITKQEECGFPLISAPSCASLGANPIPSQTIASSLALGSLLETRTTDAAQNCGKSSGNEAQAIPAIVVSTQNSVSGQASVLLQIQPVKLVSKKVEENKEAKTKLKGDEETTGGKQVVIQK